jgi:N-methylhydantoinase A
MPEDPIEFVNYRVSAIGQMKKPNLGEDRIWETGIERFDKKMGTVIFDGKQYSVPIYDRNSLDVGIFIEGPAIIGEMGSTVIVYPGQKATIDKFRNVVIYTNC